MNGEQKDFGVPKPDNTPVGIVGMQGDLYRGISNSKRNKPLWVRIASIIFCVLCLISPGLFLLFLSVAVFSEDGVMNTVIPVLMGLALTIAGISGLKYNLKR